MVVRHAISRRAPGDEELRTTTGRAGAPVQPRSANVLLHGTETWHVKSGLRPDSRVRRAQVFLDFKLVCHGFFGPELSVCGWILGQCSIKVRGPGPRTGRVGPAGQRPPRAGTGSTAPDGPELVCVHNLHLCDPQASRDMARPLKSVLTLGTVLGRMPWAGQSGAKLPLPPSSRAFRD